MTQTRSPEGAGAAGKGGPAWLAAVGTAAGASASAGPDGAFFTAVGWAKEGSKGNG